MKNKKLVIGCSAALVVFITLIGIAVGLFYAKVYRPFLSSGTEMPAEIKEPRIIAGESLLTRTEYLKFDGGDSSRVSGIGKINDLMVRTAKNSSDIEIIIAGTNGAIIADRNAEKRSSIKYQFETANNAPGPVLTENKNETIGFRQIVDLENDQVYEYLGRGGIEGAAVFDHEGKHLWGYGAFTDNKTSIDNMAAGDVDGDGIAEFVALWDGLELFDRKGARIWKQETGFINYQAEIVDTDGNGKNEIIYSTGTDMTIRDAEGNIIKRVDMPFYISNFTICHFPEKKDQFCVMAVEEGYIWLVDFKGEVVVKFQAPLSDLEGGGVETPEGMIGGTSVYRSKGLWVNLVKDESGYLAVITEYAGLDRSVLYVYKPSGQLVYHEVLPEQCTSIAVWPKSGADDVEGLLVGGERTIWRYSIR